MTLRNLLIAGSLSCLSVSEGWGQIPASGDTTLPGKLRTGTEIPEFT